MMCSELWTGLTASEAQMRITEGETVNFTSDIRTTELAVIDHSDPDHDRVTVIPASLLIDHVGAVDRIERADLPVTIQVLRWLANSELRVAAPGVPNAATAGAGLQYLADEAPTSAGVGSDSTVDQPAAYVELFSKATGKSLGTFLVAAALPEQPIGAGAPTYDARATLQTNLLSLLADAEGFSLRPLRRHEYCEKLFLARSIEGSRRKTSIATC